MNVTISDRRRVNADGITLYCGSSYHTIALILMKSTRLYTQARKKEKKGHINASTVVDHVNNDV
jgi:hypothetical protein